VFGTVVMGLLANLPLTLAPGMGLNAFFVYTACFGLGFSYANALLFVLVDGLIFLALTVTGLRKLIFEGIPSVVKTAVPAGIGLFIAFLGLQKSGLVINDAATCVNLASFNLLGSATWASIMPLLITVGTVISIAVLSKRGNKGAIFLSVLGATVVYYLLGLTIDGFYDGFMSGLSLNPFTSFQAFLSESFGIDIDGYVSIDMDALPYIVDAVGGVEIELDEPLVYNDPEQSLSINIPAGKQKLDGKTALHFLRYRSGYVRGDIGRMDAQKVFLAAMGRKVKALGAIDLARLASAILPKVETNVTLVQSLSLANIVSEISEENIVLVTLPGDEAVAEKSGASYYSLSAPATREILSAYFGASDREFDKNGVFKNEKYESFKEIYENYAPYKLYTASTISENGIIIDKHD